VTFPGGTLHVELDGVRAKLIGNAEPLDAAAALS
jgi:hypothetical protein